MWALPCPAGRGSGERDIRKKKSMETSKAEAVDFKVIDRLIEKSGVKLEVTIPLLQGIQTTYGYVPPKAILYVASHTEIPASHLYGVATFYRQFRLKPMGKNMTRVCLGTACHVQGGDRILEVTRETLQIKESEDTTEDLMFTVEAVACLGCCSLAPVVMVNKTTHGRLDGPKTRKLMKKYMQTEQGAKSKDA